jgi:hypothetical protein
MDCFDVQIRIRRKVIGILPVFRVKDSGHGMRWTASRQSFEPGIKNGIPHNQVAILMVLVPASAPVSNYDLRLVFPDDVANYERTFVVKRGSASG